MIGQPKLSVLFFLKKARGVRPDGAAPIYMRITVGGERVEVFTMRYCKPVHWKQKLRCTDGCDEHYREIDAYLFLLKKQVVDARAVLIHEERSAGASDIKIQLTGKGIKGKTILRVFAKHNERMEALTGIDYAEGTLERYKTSLEHTRAFIQSKYQVEDLSLHQLDIEFMAEYEFWLKSVRHCSHNSTMKYLANFKKIVLLCVKKGWLARDPFMGYSLARKEIPVQPLSRESLAHMAGLHLSDDHLRVVRDVFLLGCYTGLSYADLQALRSSDITLGFDGEKWIQIRRKKTEQSSRVPLLPAALVVIARLGEHQDCANGIRVVPAFTNQYLNARLKIIAAACKISSKVTTHVARHTFATTVTLGNGVPIETVSKLLGHRTLKTTQHYARITDWKVSRDMKELRERMG